MFLRNESWWCATRQDFQPCPSSLLFLVAFKTSTHRPISPPHLTYMMYCSCLEHSRNTAHQTLNNYQSRMVCEFDCGNVVLQSSSSSVYSTNLVKVVERRFHQYFSYMLTVTFIGMRNKSARSKSPTSID